MLPEHEWLPMARRLSVGMTAKVTHKQERTPAMTIGNEQDRWWAYCNRCKTGGVVQKEHVLLMQARVVDTCVALPHDLVRVTREPIQVHEFLASKKMAALYLPELWYSPTRKRLVIHTGQGSFGRDIGGASPVKWMNYNKSKVVGTVKKGHKAIITEDLFSMYKVQFALRHVEWVSVLCALGSTCTDALAMALAQAQEAVVLFDGDAAGGSGLEDIRGRMRPWGVPVLDARAPDGLDPKDMTCPEIRAHLGYEEIP